VQTLRCGKKGFGLSIFIAGKALIGGGLAGELEQSGYEASVSGRNPDPKILKPQNPPRSGFSCHFKRA
jgi:hypothetical protein